MTNAEAIELLQGRKLTMSMGFLGDEIEYVRSVNKATDMAISALEKQDGKKPTNVRLADGKLGDNGIKSGKCPSCGEEVVGNLYGEYCGICGQKLDWSDAYGVD